MLREEEKDQGSGGNWKTFSRSVSWTERPLRKSSSKPQWNSKARACLPPLQPLSVVRPSIEEWPRAGSDDLGIWPNPPTPGARPGSLTPRESSTSDLAPREFECGKDKLAFFDKECSKILDHVYLGSNAIAKSREVLRQNGITHVLNCVGFVCPEYFKNELVYKTLWLQDCPSEDITSILYDVFDYFEDVREQGGRVLVHCCHGVSRSTSLVIAYLIWKKGQSFDDAYQHVKIARGVANPNVGFACQLLQCQKRLHALPASPTSVLRMYRMAPHSPYDPLHLVPKMLSEPGPDRLDSRGAFIVQVPSVLYVWTGKHCAPMMSDNAKAAASQIFRYERARGPVLTVKDGEETFEFWDALSYRKKFEDKKSLSAGSVMRPAVANRCPGQKKLDEYDLDFEVFRRALAGGVVPSIPLSEAGSVTSLPARENGWNSLPGKFASGLMKELSSSSKICSRSLQVCDEMDVMNTSSKGVEESVSTAEISSIAQCDSPDSFASYVTSSPGCAKNNLKEVGLPGPLSDTPLLRSPSLGLVDSLSSLVLSKPNSNSRSPSISPSNSDDSSLFTCSPSSSNLSDLSFVSAQPSPGGLEAKDIDSGNSDPLQESIRLEPVDDSTCLLENGTSLPPEDTISASRISVETGLRSKPGGTMPSLEEFGGSNLPLRMILSSSDSTSQISETVIKCLEDVVIREVESSNSSHVLLYEMEGKEPISDADSSAADKDVSSRIVDEKKNDTFHHISDDMTNRIAEATNLELYQWPSMHRMETGCHILDSRYIYIILMPAVNSGTEIADVLYVWIGSSVSSNGIHRSLIRNDRNFGDNHSHLETVDRSILTEKGFSKDAQVKIVREGEEPVQLLNRLACFSLGKDIDGGIK